MIVLASASPRRRALLAEAGLAFEIDPADVSEEIGGGTLATAAARDLAERKARAVARRRGDAQAFVLGADTVVVLHEGAEEELLGKPADAEEARAMLERISGTRHRVITGVAVVHGEDALLACETTWVTMRPILPEEVEAYVGSGEWRDKAGGYAIQETADRFVTRLEGGGFDNVVGLPVGLALELLGSSGCPGLPGPLAGDPGRG